MKNVLFIVYYFPPMGGSGVQRSLKFAKYLKKFGWNPIILCPEPGAYQFFDESLKKELDRLDLEIHRVQAKTPFHTLGGRKKSTGLVTGSLAKVLRKISKLLYFPDNKKGWVKPAVNDGKAIIQNKEIDLIFSSAPPFSNHLVAQELSKTANLPFVLDYRDLFTGNHFDAGESDSRVRKKQELEKGWLNLSSGVIALDDYAADCIGKISGEEALNLKVIPHGYDPEDFLKNGISNLQYRKGKMNWLYSGLFYESNQPDVFLKAIYTLCEKNPDFKNKIHLHFQGGLDLRIKKLIKELNLEGSVSDYGYLPHDVSVANLLKADILWMISNFSENLQQIKTGKLFEYIGTKKPVLGLVHTGEASALLNEYKIGYHTPPNVIRDVTEKIEEIFLLWKQNKLPTASTEQVQKYDRMKLAGELAVFFDEIVKNQENLKL